MKADNPDKDSKGGALNTSACEAVTDVQMVGLSFVGGCLFENGVGVVPGTGSGNFRLMDLTATP